MVITGKEAEIFRSFLKTDIFQHIPKGTTHSVWNSYDSHIPLLFMGWGIKQGESNQPYHMTDIAPTVSSLLKIQFPSGAVGKPITEVIGR